MKSKHHRVYHCPRDEEGATQPNVRDSVKEHCRPNSAVENITGKHWLCTNLSVPTPEIVYITGDESIDKELKAKENVS